MVYPKASSEADLAGEEGDPDPGAADGRVADLKGVHHLDRESQPAAGFGQKGLVALFPPAEGVVLADEDLPDAEPLPEDVPDELVSRRLGVFEGKGDQDEDVHARGGDEADLLLQGCDQVEGPPLGVKDHLGVGLEGDRHGRATLPARLIDQLPEDEPGAEMDPVKLPMVDGAPESAEVFRCLGSRPKTACPLNVGVHSINPVNFKHNSFTPLRQFDARKKSVKHAIVGL